MSTLPALPSLSPDAPQPAALKRSLGLVALTLYGVGNMLGAGIYGTVGKVAEQMGNATWMAFAAAMVAAGLTGLSYACIGSRYPRAAGAAYVTQRAFGLVFLSYVIGLAVTMSGLTSMATASNVFAGYAAPLIGLHAKVIVALFLLVVAAVNFWGIRESAWLNAVCTCVEAGGLLLIIVVGLKYWGGVDYLDATSIQNPTGDVTFALVLGAAGLTFFSFIGFEDLLNVSEEVKNPRRTLPIALVTALAIAACIYMAVSITAVSVVPHQELATSQTPALHRVVQTAAPWFPSWAFAAIAMFAVANTALLNYIMGSRLAYGMARQGLMPRWLGVVHARRGTPHVAIVVLLAIAMGLALYGDIGDLARATGLLLLVSFIVVNAALVVLKLRPGEPQGSFEVPIVIPIAGICVCLPLIWQNEIKAMYIAGGILTLIVLLYLVVRPKALPDTAET